MDRLCSHLGYEGFQSHYPVGDEGIAAVVKAIVASRIIFSCALKPHKILFYLTQTHISRETWFNPQIRWTPDWSSRMLKLIWVNHKCLVH